MIEGYKLRLDAIRSVMAAGRMKEQNSGGFSVPCPAHNGTDLNLSVTPSEKYPEYAALKCFSKGCDEVSIAQAFVALGVPNEWVEKLSRSESTRDRKVVRTVEWLVRDFDGVAVLKRVRREFEMKPGEVKAPKDYRSFLPNGEPIPRRGQPGHVALSDVLYGLDRLRLYPEKAVVICEGEKAADAVSALGIKCVVGTVGASTTPSLDLVERFRDRTVCFWRDADDEGLKHAQAFRKALLPVVERFAIFVNPNARPKDDAFEYVQNGGNLATFAKDYDALTWEVPPAFPAILTPLRETLRGASLALDRYMTGDTSGLVSSGLPSLDSALRGGFAPGEVYLLGAPTGGGKTTLMQEFAMRLAASGRVVFVTPEMTLDTMGERAIVREADTAAFDGRALGETVSASVQAARDRLLAAQSRLLDNPASSNLLMFDKPDVTMEDIERVAREVRGLKAVVIDYAQQVSDDSDRRQRYLIVGEVAKKATIIAKTLGVPVLLASQVNVVRVDAKSGQNSDDGKAYRREYTFRETALLEHMASLVMILDRAKPFDPEAADEEPSLIDARLICKKNRHGRVFSRIALLWDRERFSIREPGDDEPTATEPTRYARDPSDGVVTGDTPRLALPPGRGVVSIDRERVYREADGGNK